jgi:hypothetical protein
MAELPYIDEHESRCSGKDVGSSAPCGLELFRVQIAFGEETLRRLAERVRLINSRWR